MKELLHLSFNFNVSTQEKEINSDEFRYLSPEIRTELRINSTKYNCLIYLIYFMNKKNISNLEFMIFGTICDYLAWMAS